MINHQATTTLTRAVVETNNCASNFRAGNEVVTMFPID